MEADWEEAQPYLLDIEEAFVGSKRGPTVPAAIEPPHVDRRLAFNRAALSFSARRKTSRERERLGNLQERVGWRR